MSEIRFRLLGNAAAVANFQRIKAEAPAFFQRRMNTVTLRLASYVKTDKLSGQVLHRRSGLLSRSIHGVVEVSGQTVVGRVGSRGVEYAAYHEFGFTGTETVREHLRTITKAWGRPLDEPLTVTVHEYERQVDYPPHSFLRSALKDLSEWAVSTLSDLRELIHGNP